MPFNGNAFQGDQNVVDVLDSGCQNDGGNPVAVFDVDVSNDAIGDLGSPFGYVAFTSRSPYSMPQ